MLLIHAKIMLPIRNATQKKNSENDSHSQLDTATEVLRKAFLCTQPWGHAITSLSKVGFRGAPDSQAVAFCAMRPHPLRDRAAQDHSLPIVSNRDSSGDYRAVY